MQHTDYEISTFLEKASSQLVVLLKGNSIFQYLCYSFMVGFPSSRAAIEMDFMNLSNAILTG